MLYHWRKYIQKKLVSISQLLLLHYRDYITRKFEANTRIASTQQNYVSLQESYKAKSKSITGERSSYNHLMLNCTWTRSKQRSRMLVFLRHKRKSFLAKNLYLKHSLGQKVLVL